jgi:hypothetical protein
MKRMNSSKLLFKHRSISGRAWRRYKSRLVKL